MKFETSEPQLLATFLCCNVQFEMAQTHTEPALNKLIKPELVQLLLNTEANMGGQISTLTAEVKELNNYLKKLDRCCNSKKC